MVDPIPLTDTLGQIRGYLHVTASSTVDPRWLQRAEVAMPISDERLRRIRLKALLAATKSDLDPSIRAILGDDVPVLLEVIAELQQQITQFRQERIAARMRTRG